MKHFYHGDVQQQKILPKCSGRISMSYEYRMLILTFVFFDHAGIRSSASAHGASHSKKSISSLRYRTTKSRAAGSRVAVECAGEELGGAVEIGEQGVGAHPIDDQV